MAAAFKVKENKITSSQSGFSVTCSYFKGKPYYHFRHKEDKLSVNRDVLKEMRELFKNVNLLKRIDKKAQEYKNKKGKKSTSKKDETSGESSSEDEYSSNDDVY